MKSRYSLVGLQMQNYRNWLAKEIKHAKRIVRIHSKEQKMLSISGLMAVCESQVLRQCAKQLREKTE